MHPLAVVDNPSRLQAVTIRCKHGVEVARWGQRHQNLLAAGFRGDTCVRVFDVEVRGGGTSAMRFKLSLSAIGSGGPRAAW